MKYFIEVSELESGNLCYVVTHISSKVFCRCKDMIVADAVCSVLNFQRKRTKFLCALCLVGAGALHDDFLEEKYLRRVKKEYLIERLEKITAKFEVS